MKKKLFRVVWNGEPLRSKTPKDIGKEFAENLKDMDVEEEVTISIRRIK